MATLKQRALELERKGILPPLMNSGDDEYSEEANDDVAPPSSSLSFKYLAEVAGRDATTAAWLKELSSAQRPELWNLFVHNKGTFVLGNDAWGGMDTSSSGYGSRITKNAADNSVKVAMELGYSVDGRVEGFNEHSLFHELGHMVDDQAFLMGKDDATMGFHSNSNLWRWLTNLDAKILPNGGIKQIGAERRESGYLSTHPEWHSELFAEAVNWHMGPKLAKAISMSRDGIISKPAIYSPLVQAYMDTAVAMDIAIQSQDKPYTARQEDRKKLQEALKLPPEQFFDLDTVNELEGRIKNGKTNVIKKAATEALAKYIEAGLQKMTASVAAQINIPAPAINSRQK